MSGPSTSADQSSFARGDQLTILTEDRNMVLTAVQTLLKDHRLDMQIQRRDEADELGLIIPDDWTEEKISELKTTIQREFRVVDVVFLRRRPQQPVGLQSVDPYELESRSLVLGTQLHSLPYGAYLHEGTYEGRKVHIKLVPLQMGYELPPNFAKEVDARKSINQPEIVVQLIGICRKPEAVCIVTEFFELRCLRSYVDEGKNRWDRILRVVQVALKIAGSMRFVHDKGVIHCNLKKDSIVVGGLPGHESFRLTNLEFVTRESEVPTRQAENENYEWMAPEVLRGEHFNRKADVYSFAIMLCELLMKGKPYGSMTPLEVADRGLLGQLPNLPKKWKKMYPRLPAMIEDCSKFDKTQRPNFTQIEERLKKMVEEVLSHIGNTTRFRCIS